MPQQRDLFSSPPQQDAAQPAAGRGLSLQVRAAKLTPEQKRFNRLLERVETLSRKLEEFRHLADAHRPLRASTLQPLEQRQRELNRQMARWLHARLLRKGLTRTQRHIATQILCSLTENLALDGDEEMRVLHDAHSPESLSDLEKAATAHLQEMMEDAGIDLGGTVDGNASAEQLLHAAMRQAHERAEAEQAMREAYQQERKSRKPKTAAQQMTAQTQQDAEATLRTLYRQLASALHPDRETDPEERLRKTALMGEVNAAYGRRDLMALLALQLRTEHLDAEAVARMTHEKMAALSLLLKEQAGALEHDVRIAQAHIHDEFELGTFGPVSATVLNRVLAGQREDLQEQIALMEQDLLRVQDDKQFKRWLKEQQQMAEEEAFFPDDFDDLDEDWPR